LNEPFLDSLRNEVMSNVYCEKKKVFLTLDACKPTVGDSKTKLGYHQNNIRGVLQHY